MSLYTINQQILECIDLSTGEILDTAAFDQLQMERDEKIENIALWIKSLKADALAYKNEKDAFAEKQKRTFISKASNDRLPSEKQINLIKDISTRKGLVPEAVEERLKSITTAKQASEAIERLMGK